MAPYPHLHLPVNWEPLGCRLPIVILKHRLVADNTLNQESNYGYLEEENACVDTVYNKFRTQNE